MILCCAAFIAILGCMRPVGHRLDTPAKASSKTDQQEATIEVGAKPGECGIPEASEGRVRGNEWSAVSSAAEQVHGDVLSDRERHSAFILTAV